MTDTINSAAIKVITTAAMTTSPDIGTTSYSFNESDTKVFTHGTGNDQVNQVWTDSRTISASSSENLDLYGGLTNALNTTLNFSTIKAIVVHANAANTNNVLIGGSSNGVAGMFVLGGDALLADVQIVIPPDGEFLITAPKAGFTVTNSTGDILKVANSGGTTSVTYTIKIYGVV